MIKSWSDNAWEEYLYLEEKDKRLFRRLNKLIQDIDRNGYDGIGKPEPLSGGLSGYWSRRIDDKNRLVYKIQGQQILIVQCRTHYEK